MHYFLLLIANILLCLCPEHFETGKGKSVVKIINAKSEIEISLIDNYPKPAELVYDNRNQQAISKDKFFPIGWSRDGKFAYVTEPADEACGCYFFGLFIQDMITDKITWKWEYNGEDNTMNFDKIWKANKKMFFDSLKFYHIQSQSFSSFKMLPVKVNNNLYDFTLVNKTWMDPDFNKTMIQSTSITSKFNGKVKKVIFNTAYKSHILSNAIKGYLKSPYEKRIAIFYIKETRGWEGPPNVLSFNLIGYNLRKK